MDDPKIIAVIVSTIVASIVSTVTALITIRWQYRAKLIELEQLQLKEVLLHRMKAYPMLWRVILTYGRNWEIEGKTRDVKWAREFLEKLNACNAKWGVFFSQQVYEKFHEYRQTLIAIEAELARGGSVQPELLQHLATISLGREGEPGLSTQLKADLGSYREMALRRRSK